MSKAVRRNQNAKSVKFEHRLALTNWMLDLFGVATFRDLAKHLDEAALEGFTEDGISRFYQQMKLLFNRAELPNDLLLAYDENIVRYWKAITERRNADGQNLYPKYFQYLSLLFAEIYLDRYFRGPEKLLEDLNAYAEQFNRGETLQQKAVSANSSRRGCPRISRSGPMSPRTCESWPSGVLPGPARRS